MNEQLQRLKVDAMLHGAVAGATGPLTGKHVALYADMNLTTSRRDFALTLLTLAA